MVRILYYGLGYNAGGIERYLLRIARYLDKQEFQIGFIDEWGDRLCYRNELKELGATFFPITRRRINPLKNQKELRELFRQNHFDIFHCNINTLSYSAPIFEALKNNCKVIVHSRNAGHNESIQTSLLHKINFKRIAPKNIIRLAVSQEAGRWLFGEKKDFLVINNGIDISRFTFCIDDRYYMRKKLGLESKFVLGHIGVFLPVKNQRFVVEIFRHIIKRPELEDAVLLLVGDGTEKDSVMKFVKEQGLEKQVIFLGSRADISELMCAMDFLIFPSLYEGFPNVILEAQTNGLPCLMSNVITKEVILTDLVHTFPLNCTAEEWAAEILRQNINADREKYAAIIDKKGFSHAKEKEKIERLYHTCTK